MYITEAIVVVVEQVRSEVQAALERTGLKIRVEYVGIPGTEDWGTADTLRHLSDKIKVKQFLYLFLEYHLHIIFYLQDSPYPEI